MKKGTNVSWQIEHPATQPGQELAPGRGHGVTISDEQDGHVLVAVESLRGELFPGFYQVIWCSVTWLTVE